MGRRGPSRIGRDPAWHHIFLLSPWTVPPLALQSAALISFMPLPLQAFLPAHSLWALAHAPWPLQALAPRHFTLSPPAFSSACAATAPERKSPAAALAISTPFASRFITRLLAVEWVPDSVLLR